jgi:hypothetical protein
VGQAKVVAQARRLAAISPSLAIDAVADDVANVPLGRLRASVIVACLDSLAARLRVNEAAWRLGVAWIDGGIDPAQSLVRVNAYLPATNHPCLECALEEGDYRALGTRHPCAGLTGEPEPTNGSASLGALAASLLALECEKVLAADWTRALAHRQVVIDTAHHRHFVTAFRRNPRCRFDHEVWRLETLTGLSAQSPLTELMARARKAARAGENTSVRVPGRPFAKALHCPQCGHGVDKFYLLNRLASGRQCERCGGELLATGFKLVERLDARRLPRAVLRRTLRQVGLRPGDVVSVPTRRGEKRFVISYDGM